MELRVLSVDAASVESRLAVGECNPRYPYGYRDSYCDVDESVGHLLITYEPSLPSPVGKWC